MSNIPDNIASIIGSNIAELRKDRGLTQKDFADILHVSKSAVSHYEQGISVPTIQVLITIADYFNVNVDYLLGRCKDNIKYSDINDIYLNSYTVGKLLTMSLSLSKKKRKYLIDTINMLFGDIK
jgi:transcriptional regulator with XRE-family HTH domain